MRAAHSATRPASAVSIQRAEERRGEARAASAEHPVAFVEGQPPRTISGSCVDQVPRGPGAADPGRRLDDAADEHLVEILGLPHPDAEGARRAGPSRCRPRRPSTASLPAGEDPVDGGPGQPGLPGPRRRPSSWPRPAGRRRPGRRRRCAPAGETTARSRRRTRSADPRAVPIQVTSLAACPR